MARTREMTALEVRRLKGPGRHWVGGVAGLHLLIYRSGARAWVLRVTIAGKRRDIGIGAYPDISLADARERARDLRAKIRDGHDPVEERRELERAMRDARARRLTFDEAASRYIRAKRHEFRSRKHGDQWEASLQAYASPVIGDTPVDEIDLPHVIAVLEPIWTTKTETAKRLRGRIEAVLAWAAVSGYRSRENPARWKGNLDAVFPSPGRTKKTTHYPALPWRQVPSFMEALRERDGVASRALEFAILTAARSGEVRLATWDEIEGNVWTVPAERIKAGRRHRVPLSRDAYAVLDRVPRMAESPYVFPSPQEGKAMSDMTLSAVIKRMSRGGEWVEPSTGRRITVHGFRSAFKDWARSCTSYADEVSELALAHVNDDATRSAYARDELIELRARLMEDWARFCREGIGTADVTPIGRATQG